jgi:hypothetical protein
MTTHNDMAIGGEIVVMDGVEVPGVFDMESREVHYRNVSEISPLEERARQSRFTDITVEGCQVQPWMITGDQVRMLTFMNCEKSNMPVVIGRGVKVLTWIQHSTDVDEGVDILRVNNGLAGKNLSHIKIIGGNGYGNILEIPRSVDHLYVDSPVNMGIAFPQAFYPLLSSIHIMGMEGVVVDMNVMPCLSVLEITGCTGSVVRGRWPIRATTIYLTGCHVQAGIDLSELFHIRELKLDNCTGVGDLDNRTTKKLQHLTLGNMHLQREILYLGPRALTIKLYGVTGVEAINAWFAKSLAEIVLVDEPGIKEIGVRNRLVAGAVSTNVDSYFDSNILRVFVDVSEYLSIRSQNTEQRYTAQDTDVRQDMTCVHNEENTHSELTHVRLR